MAISLEICSQWMNIAQYLFIYKSLYVKKSNDIIPASEFNMLNN